MLGKLVGLQVGTVECDTFFVRNFLTSFRNVVALQESVEKTGTLIGSSAAFHSSASVLREHVLVGKGIDASKGFSAPRFAGISTAVAGRDHSNRILLNKVANPLALDNALKLLQQNAAK